MSDKDTIYREAAIDAICKACSMEGDYHKCDGYPETSTWCDELVALRALPSAQPERKKGRWIRTRTMVHDGELYCDQCGQEHPEQKCIWSFCPNCGAEMCE